MDATGAGDAFRAAFAVALLEGLELGEALKFASAAGTMSVMRMGAEPSMPTRQQVMDLLQFVHGSSDASVSLLSEAMDNEYVDLEQSCSNTDNKGLRTSALKFASRLNSMQARRDLVEENTGDNVLG